jgi:hypothetical protein
MPTFDAPVTPDTLTFELFAFDGYYSSSNTVTINVNAFITPPNADAGGDLIGVTDNQIVLDGSASSDPDGDSLSYTWTQTGGTTVNLDLTDQARPSFFAPSNPEILTFDLVVNDNFDSSLADSVQVIIQSAQDTPICANAYADHPILEKANHKYRKIKIKGVTYEEKNDTNSKDKTKIIITGITQDEPTSELPGRDIPVDAKIRIKSETEDWGEKRRDFAYVRRERSPNGDGRVYMINFQAENAITGAICNGSVSVCMPRGKKEKSCIDSGQAYNSLF